MQSQFQELNNETKGNNEEGAASGLSWNEALWRKWLTENGICKSEESAASLAASLAKQELGVESLAALQASAFDLAAFSIPLGVAARLLDAVEKEVARKETPPSVWEKVPIGAFFYDMFLDRVPAFEDAEKLLNILALTTALILSVSAGQMSSYDADELKAWDESQKLALRCRYEPGIHEVRKPSWYLMKLLAMTDGFLGTSLLMVVILYVSIVAIGSENARNKAQMRQWWRYNAPALLLAIVFGIMGIVYFFLYLAELQALKFGLRGSTEVCPEVVLYYDEDKYLYLAKCSIFACPDHITIPAYTKLSDTAVPPVVMSPPPPLCAFPAVARRLSIPPPGADSKLTTGTQPINLPLASTRVSRRRAVLIPPPDDSFRLLIAP
eukprot:g77994.t1